MKVLHSVHAFLRISENWIYPQIARVPGIEPGVLCASVENRQLFALRDGPLLLDTPPWSESLGLPRLANSLAFRLGSPFFVARRATARWGPDLLHAHFGARGWEMLALKRHLGVPLITSFYGVDAWMLPRTGDLWAGRLRELFAEGDLFLVEGPAMRDRLIAIGCAAEKLEVARLGVDVGALPAVTRDGDLPLRVVMMARFVEKKGLPDGLRACAQAAREGADLHVTIIGDATDPAGREIGDQLRGLAASPALAGRVEFTGFMAPDEARKILCRSHVFLCPSKHAADGDAEGGSPLALTEAMGMGLLCIGTRHCDIPEVILDGHTGAVCESGDSAGLAAALMAAAHDVAGLAASCEAGRRHVAERFNLEHQLPNLASIYRRYD
jgi:colanic acid/amylovoran biosynthesis glycosyltransferase